MSKLDAVIADLAERFAVDLLAALKGASLADLATNVVGARASKPAINTRARAAMSGGASKARHRRSLDEIKKFADRIVAVVKGHRDGISAEEMKSILKLARGRASHKVIAKPLSHALTSKRITKTGTRRSTRYFPA